MSVIATLSMNDVQSAVLSQLSLATFWNLIVTDPVEPLRQGKLVVLLTVCHVVLLGTTVKAVTAAGTYKSNSSISISISISSNISSNYVPLLYLEQYTFSVATANS
jgi:hypothetical protein